ncbi:MAG TPA: beta-galactosidase [Chthonomonadales bacterium]|nr:beta-galactosidase [Chthonomonadales bacterium]
MLDARWCLMAAALAMVLGALPAAGRPAAWRIRDGRFYDRGQPVFLKIAKPLRNFALEGDCNRLIADLPILRAKHYNTIEINCYWHHFDRDGDGEPDVSLAPLRRLVDAIHAAGMYPCLSVETYGVGGGALPEGFWRRHPDAVAVNAQGRRVTDTEYGFGSIVPSLHHVAYRETVHRFIRAMTRGIDHRKILWFETTVEPQYIGNQPIDYSESARRAYSAWLARRGLRGPAFPDRLPAPDSFVRDATWNRFRAEALAEWVNGDAAAFRSVAGRDAYIAVDYLETAGPEMVFRNGDSLVFLENLTSATVIQVNWHWHLGTRSPNELAYRNLREVMARTRRRWAISEHMTLNGSDFQPQEVPALLRATLERGSLLGWEFVSVGPNTADPFSLYRDDWSPKPLIAEVDDRWDSWMQEVRAAWRRRSP